MPDLAMPSRYWGLVPKRVTRWRAASSHGMSGRADRTFDERLAGIDDPAELVAAGFRLSARMTGSHPELMQVLRRRGLGYLHTDNGLSSRARRDLESGIASGRFTAVEPAVALSALGGTLLTLLELKFSRPDLDGDEAASHLAEMVLRMLGLCADDAREVARRPLPDLGR
ncbi:TetR/AcrR family transcriptional regulator [Streptomyces sp. NPDC020996]|uniref:TetR/AcrR family transcriptional regulator n=1 Tax=Streptomyces sp. NPDC020996 TaxID=3154791 RepID=UPI0033F5A0BA